MLHLALALALALGLALDPAAQLFVLAPAHNVEPVAEVRARAERLAVWFSEGPPKVDRRPPEAGEFGRAQYE